MRTPHTIRTIAALTLALCALALAGGCTIVKYVDPPKDPEDVKPDPKIVDMLVLVDLDRSAANLNDSYHQVLGQLYVALGERGITVRKAAMAPLYHQVGGAVPLLYGDKDEEGVFKDFGEAIAYYTYDDGAKYLQEQVEADGENLAVVGMELDERPIYKPGQAQVNATPYFELPADGFLVVSLSASPRRCGLDEAGCQLDGRSPQAYFTETDEAGNARWLQLAGGQSLPVSKVFHLAIVTAEDKNFEDFESDCTLNPGFPAGKLDVMEPSDKAYFGPLIEAIEDQGGHAAMIDLCEAMSLAGPPALLSAAGDFQSALR